MLHQASLNRLRAAQMRPEAIATIFEHMAMAVGEMGVAASQYTLGFQRPEDEVRVGDLVPVIVLSLVPASIPIPQAVGTPP